MKKRISILTMKLLGWRIVGEKPTIPKSIILSAPHTSNWDFFYGYLCAKALDIPVKFLMKKELFIFPFNFIFTHIGGIPVDRKRKTNMREKLAELIQREKEIHIAITPEGTRNRTDEWKTGFHYIAQATKIPVVISFIDYKEKKIGFKEIVYTSENLEKDLIYIKNIYRTITAKYPEKFSLGKNANEK